MQTCSAICSPISATSSAAARAPTSEILADARNQAIEELQAEAASRGANAVVSIDLDYEVIGPNGSMLMVSASGTAVRV